MNSYNLRLMNFPGFYESCFLYSDIEYNEASRIQDEIEAEKGKIVDALIDCIDYEAYQNDVCISFGDFFESEFNHYYKTNLVLNFEEMISPKYYNFTTDASYYQLKISNQDKTKIEALFNENRAKLANLCKDFCSSRSGFISFYEDDIYDEAWDNFWEDEIRLGYIFLWLLNVLSDEDAWNVEYYYYGMNDQPHIACYYSLDDIKKHIEERQDV